MVLHVPLPVLPHLLVQPCVCEAQWLALSADAQAGHVMCLLNQHVHQGGLAVMKRTNNLATKEWRWQR
jgi:hypothetical protein